MNNKRKVVILKGVSGSGKSTVAEMFAEPKVICCADHFYEDIDGSYNFDASKLGQAHQQCKDKFLRNIDDEFIKTIIIANTNTKKSDYQFYVDEAEKRGIDVIFLVVEKRHDNPNSHGVPDFVLQRQHENLKNNLKLI